MYCDDSVSVQYAVEIIYDDGPKGFTMIKYGIVVTYSKTRNTGTVLNHNRQNNIKYRIKLN